MAPASATPVDQKVRDEIKDKLGVNMCVEAGAGTGKTTSLVDRIVELLATSTTDADHIGVITFTEKAAAELSSRVRERLERAIADEKNPARREQLTDAVRALYRSRIETIHAFAANVLRERPVEAGLDPEYTILSWPRRRSALRRALHRLARRAHVRGEARGRARPQPRHDAR